MTLLTCHHLYKSYHQGDQEVQVLKDINLAFEAGDFIAIMGSSGSGKSTLLNCLSGMSPINRGEIVFDGLKLESLSESQLADLRRTRMGFIFQASNFLPYLNLIDNIILPMTLRKTSPLDQLYQRAQDIMALTGIEDLADRMPDQVSGGQLQRAGICRALMGSPDIIFADEPTGALNSQKSQEIMALFNQINQELGTAILLVTHDVKVAAICHKVLLMEDGRIMEEINQGPWQAIVEEDRLAKLNASLVNLAI